MKLGLITLMGTPSFRNQANLIEKLFKEHGYDVNLFNIDDSQKPPKERYDKGIAFVPLWLRYIFGSTSILAPWFSRKSLIYGPVDGPLKLNVNLFEVMKNFDIAVTSQYCKECLEKNHIPVKDVIPHGLDFNDFRGFEDARYTRLKTLRERYPNRKILFSNINPLHRKGLPHLVKALQILNEKVSGDYVFILHTGLAAAHTVINKLAPNDRIDLQKIPNLVIEDQYGRLPFRAIVEKTMACDIFVCSSLLEGFGEPILEAMACKKPIVCLDAPAMNELVSEKEAWIFPMTYVREEVWDNGAIAQLHEYEPKSLAEAMQHAIENEVEGKEKAEAAYKKSLDYDYRKVYSKLIAY